MVNLEKINLKDRFEICKNVRFNAGGQAEPILVYDKISEEKRVLKIFKYQGKEERTDIKNAHKEHIALEKIKHDGVVESFGAYILVDDGNELKNPTDQREYAILILQYIEGENLREVISKEGPFSVEEFQNFALWMSAALWSCHIPEFDLAKKGLIDTEIQVNSIAQIHNDISAPNIVRGKKNETGNYVYVLLDFALSMHIQENDSKGGTAVYVPPERWKGEKATSESDVYSMGVVMFFVLTGEFPFVEKNKAGFKFAHINKPVPNIWDIRKKNLQKIKNKSKVLENDIPAWCITVVESCLEKDKTKRIQHGKELNDLIKNGIKRKLQKQKDNDIDNDRLYEQKWSFLISNPKTKSYELKAFIAKYNGCNKKFVNSMNEYVLLVEENEKLEIITRERFNKLLNSVELKKIEAFITEFPNYDDIQKLKDHKNKIWLEEKEIDELINRKLIQDIDIYLGNDPQTRFKLKLENAKKELSILNHKRQRKWNRILRTGIVIISCFILGYSAYVGYTNIQRNNNQEEKIEGNIDHFLNRFTQYRFSLPPKNNQGKIKLLFANFYAFPLVYYGNTIENVSGFKEKEMLRVSHVLKTPSLNKATYKILNSKISGKTIILDVEFGIPNKPPLFIEQLNIENMKIVSVKLLD